MVLAGLNEGKLSKLAIARADASWCYLRATVPPAAARCCPVVDQRQDRALQDLRGAGGTFPHPDKSKWSWKGMAPHIPLDVRPRRGVENYTLLWEAVWKPELPVDLILARRIGNSDFFVVLAQWDLTPIERFVMQSRIGRQ